MEAKRQEWCFRLDQEKRHSNVSFFVTLTYEDSALTYADDQPCLVKRDVQLFLKQLRKRLEPRSLKYYCVGEYGDQSRDISPLGRPHYHLLMFYRGNLDRFTLHKFIKDFWTFGIAQVLPILGAQGYVTKYVMKFDKREHLVKPFSLISQGLGKDYLTESMVNFHRQHLTPFAMKPGGYKISLPRYYKDKIFTELDRLILKKRCDLYRKDLELRKLANIDLKMSFGVNPFAESIINYQHRVYQSLKVYREKKKL